MSYSCFNYFSITAATAGINKLHEILSTAPKNDAADGWLDVLNVMLATDPKTGTRDEDFYDVLENSEKRFPFDTQWNVENHDDDTSTLSFWCVTKYYGYETHVCSIMETFSKHYQATRFEYFELEEEDHGYWCVFDFDKRGNVADFVERRAVQRYFNDSDEIRDEDGELIFAAPQDWDIEEHYVLTLWDDGTITNEMDVQPITLRTV